MIRQVFHDYPICNYINPPPHQISPFPFYCLANITFYHTMHLFIYFIYSMKTFIFMKTGIFDSRKIM